MGSFFPFEVLFVYLILILKVRNKNLRSVVNRNVISLQVFFFALIEGGSRVTKANFTLLKLMALGC